MDTVTVSAPAADSSASVSVSGNEGLQPGDNEIVCTVTAADGQTVKIYRIRVTRGEGEAGGEKPMVAEVPLRTYDRTITVLSAEEGIESPEGFIKCSVNIDGKAVRGWIRSDQAGSDNQADYCLFYAMNEEGRRDFTAMTGRRRPYSGISRIRQGAADLRRNITTSPRSTILCFTTMRCGSGSS